MEQVWSLTKESDNSLQEQIKSNEFAQIIDGALAQLPAQKQEIYRLSRINGYSHDEIAGLTGLSKSRVNNILVETVKHIKSVLEIHSRGMAIVFWVAIWDKLS